MFTLRLILLPTLLLAACEGGGDSGGDSAGGDDSGANSEPAELAIAGVYTDDFGGNHTITTERWEMGYTGSDPSVFHILEFDNPTTYAVAQNDAGNDYFPSLFSRFDWVYADSDLWFCQTTFDAASQEAASGTAAANATDPATAGCGGYAWTKLTPQ